MEGKSNILCCIISRKVKIQQKCKKKKKDLCSVWRRYGEVYGEVIDWVCQKWFPKFHARDFLLDDAPQSDGPVEVNRDEIKTSIDNNQC